MKKKKDHVIKIPHINTRIVVRNKLKGDIDEARAYSKRICPDEFLIVIKLPITGSKSATDLVHELVHILQYIVNENNMSFIHEREHLAYIAGYLFHEICKL